MHSVLGAAQGSGDRAATLPVPTLCRGIVNCKMKIAKLKKPKTLSDQFAAL